MSEYKNRVPVIVFSMYIVFCIMFFTTLIYSIVLMINGVFIMGGGGGPRGTPTVVPTLPIFALLIGVIFHTVTRKTVQIDEEQIVIIDGKFIKKVFRYEHMDRITYDASANMLQFKQEGDYWDGYLSLKGFKKDKDQILKTIRQYHEVKKGKFEW